MVVLLDKSYTSGILFTHTLQRATVFFFFFFFFISSRHQEGKEEGRVGGRREGGRKKGGRKEGILEYDHSSS